MFGSSQETFCSLGGCYELWLRSGRKEQGLDKTGLPNLREQLPMKRAGSALSENRLPIRSELFLLAWGESALADVFLDRDCFL